MLSVVDHIGQDGQHFWPFLAKDFRKLGKCNDASEARLTLLIMINQRVVLRLNCWQVRGAWSTAKRTMPSA